ncbi:hypothetical protein DXV65_02245 [Pseudomonas fluorescens]|jgi:hypothetical protein|nr:hypothetical protein DXV65_02245 [Pseudomonas fluorescens]QTV19459.1 hypothetical protein J9321_11190 [Pseudomonas fluorescens]
MSIEYFLSLPARDQIALGSAGLMLIAVILDIFLAYRKLERMEDLLDLCSLINNYKRIFGDNLRGRLGRLCAVYIAIALPKWNAKRGVINAKQVEHFPRKLKLVLHATTLTGLAGAIGATIFHFGDQLSL